MWRRVKTSLVAVAITIAMIALAASSASAASPSPTGPTANGHNCGGTSSTFSIRVLGQPDFGQVLASLGGSNSDVTEADCR